MGDCDAGAHGARLMHITTDVLCEFLHTRTHVICLFGREPDTGEGASGRGEGREGCRWAGVKCGLRAAAK